MFVDETRGRVNDKLDVWRHALEFKGFRLSRTKTEYMKCKFSNTSRVSNVDVMIRSLSITKRDSFRSTGSPYLIPLMIIFLTGLVPMILMWTLRNDYAKYAREDDDLETLKSLNGIGIFFLQERSFVATFIVCYALTSFISGYVNGTMYSRNGGKSWIKSMILTASLFPFLCFGIGFTLNTIGIFYASLATIPFGTMVTVFVIWAFISFPLALLGTVFGRNWSGAPNNPCRIKTIPRPIPEKKWYLTPYVVSLMRGLLPFGSIFMEKYFVFTSFGNYKALLSF